MEFRDPPPVRYEEDKTTRPDPQTFDSRHLAGVVQALVRSIADSGAPLDAEEKKALDRLVGALGLPETTAPGLVLDERLARETGARDRVAHEEAPAPDAVVGERRARRPSAPAPLVHEMDLASMSIEVRRHVLALMFRAAFVNGRCGDLELAVLRRVSEAMGLTPEQFDGVRASSEGEVRLRRRLRVAVSVAAGLALIALAVVLIHDIRDWLQGDDEARLVERIDQAVVDRATKDAELIRSTSARLEQLEQRIAEREQQQSVVASVSSDASPAASSDEELRAELLALRNALEKLKAQPDAFKVLESSYRESVLLIMVAFDMVKGVERRTLTGYGTGFFVTPTGLILTNKHVVEPWKFEVEVAEMVGAGYRLDEGSIRMAAWPTGARVWKAPGKAIFGNAYNNLQDTLRIAAIPPDLMERRSGVQPNGKAFTADLHAQDDSDLALLEARVPSPVVALPLAPDPSTIEKLDPVMVLGFPAGPAMQESDRADTSPSLGTVRKVEDTVQVSAPIVQGNSGGPVIDLQGRVIGIATRTALGEASLGVCIQSRHAIELLPPAGELITEAVRLIDGGDGALAGPLLDLAVVRGAGSDELARVERLWGRIHRSSSDD